MKKKALYDSLSEFCIAFTCIVLAVVIINSIQKGEIGADYGNVLLGFVMTAIGYGVLKMHFLFEKLPTLWMIVLQYIMAMTLVWAVVFIGGLYRPLHPNAYRDTWRSFSLFYCIAAAIYYWDLKKSIEKQNQMLKKLNKKV